MIPRFSELARPVTVQTQKASAWLPEVTERRQGDGLSAAQLIPEIHDASYETTIVELVFALAMAKVSSWTDAGSFDWHLGMLSSIAGAMRLFGHDDHNRLQLTDSTENVRGRARGVVSEELGIALAIDVAMNRCHDGQSAVVVDVDNPGESGAGQTGHRADYIIMRPGSKEPRNHDIIVEAKGRLASGARVAKTLDMGLRQAETARTRSRSMVVGSIRLGLELNVAAMEPSQSDSEVPGPLSAARAEDALRRQIAQFQRVSREDREVAAGVTVINPWSLELGMGVNQPALGIGFGPMEQLQRHLFQHGERGLTEVIGEAFQQVELDEPDGRSRPDDGPLRQRVGLARRTGRNGTREALVVVSPTGYVLSLSREPTP